MTKMFSYKNFIGREITSLFVFIFFIFINFTFPRRSFVDKKRRVLRKKKKSLKNNNVFLFEKNKDKKSKRICIIVHGTAGGFSTYNNQYGPEPSFDGALNWTSDFLQSKKAILNNYQKQNLFANYHRRAFFFHNNALPIIMGLAPGIKKITRKTITERAFNGIFIPFVKNFFKAHPQYTVDDVEFYMFSWLGMLSPYDRSIAAQLFISQLRTLIKKKSDDIAISLYCFSHGGNVVLEGLSSAPSTVIDELVLLAVPISKKTKEWMQKSTIKKVYNFYSKDDIVQGSDFMFSFPFPKKIINLASRQKKRYTSKISNILVSCWAADKKRAYRHQDFYFFLAAEKNCHCIPFLTIAPLVIPLLQNKSNRKRKYITCSKHVFTFSYN
jgi:hypothetical protein